MRPEIGPDIAEWDWVGLDTAGYDRINRIGPENIRVICVCSAIDSLYPEGCDESKSHDLPPLSKIVRCAAARLVERMPLNTYNLPLQTRTELQCANAKHQPLASLTKPFKTSDMSPFLSIAEVPSTNLGSRRV